MCGKEKTRYNLVLARATTAVATVGDFERLYNYRRQL